VGTSLDGRRAVLWSCALGWIIGVEGKLVLVFLLPLTTWTGNEAAARTNRDFLTAFIAAHPDYSRVFGVLVARALKPDRSGGFATVYKVGVGFI